MVDEDSSYPCPVCRTLTTLSADCPGCGRAPDPDAASVITMDLRLTDLQHRMQAAEAEAHRLREEIVALRRERELVATRVRMAVAAERASTTQAPTVYLGAPALVATRAEASPRTVQNLLFALGGLLLGIAAIVFTAVAYTQFGIVGRAGILAVVTLVTLAVPPLVLRRGLRATAETFAALGLLLMLLDGWAAWYLDFQGIQSAWDGNVYSGVIALITAVVGFGYGRMLGLTGPRQIALLLAQPVLPLLFATSHLQVSTWSLLCSAIAAGDALVVWRSRGQLKYTILAWMGHALALFFAVVLAMTSPVADLSDALRTSAAVLALVAAFALGAVASGNKVHSGFAGAVAALGLAWALAIPPMVQWEPHLFTLTLVCTLVAALAGGLYLALPGPWTTGGNIGAVIALGVPGLIGAGFALSTGVLNLRDATPWWHARLADFDGSYDWRISASIALVLAATAAVTRGLSRAALVAAQLPLLAFALPDNPAVTWWAPSIVDLVFVAGALALAAFGKAKHHWIPWALSAAVLIGHSLATAQARPTLSAVALAGVVVLGLGTSALTKQRVLGGLTLAVSDVLLPLLGYTAVIALGGTETNAWRLLLVVVLALPLVGSTKAYRDYHTLACFVVVLYPLWPVLPEGESRAVYAALATVAAALTCFRDRRTDGRRLILAIPAAFAFYLTYDAWGAVLFQPFANLDHIWSGSATATPHIPIASAAALTLLLGAVVLAVWDLGPRNVAVGACCAAVLPVLAWLTVAGVPWPVIPAVSLVLGLSLLVAVALRRTGLAGFAVPVGLLLATSGLAGTLPEKWSTIAGLGLTLVALGVIGVTGFNGTIRVLGWVFGAAAKLALAIAIGRAAELRPDRTALIVLAAAAILLAISHTRLAQGSGRAVEVSAHCVALVAAMICGDHRATLALILVLWGVATGLTVAFRQTERALRATAAGVLISIAWVLLLNTQHVATLEAYTLPIAVVAVAVGVLVAHWNATLSSWPAYGPALAAALLPSLALVLAQPGGAMRRLLLGAGAIVVVLLGSIWRRQAPVVLGGATALVLGLHELFVIWQRHRLPAWIPLSIGGALLIALAITYERRLRDIARLRHAISQMR